MKKKPTSNKTKVRGTEITVIQREAGDFISLTDMVRNFDGGSALIEQWLKNKDTVLFLGVWEQLNNPDFKTPEFEGIRNEAGLFNVALFGQTVGQWRDANPGKDGNMRDHATLEQLLVLANLENMNAEFIHMEPAQSDRLKRLNARMAKQLEGAAS